MMPQKSRLRKLQDKSLVWFDNWFSSPQGVWQTVFVCLAICVVEVVWPSLDPHYFYLLAILTVYSAITQPALAQGNAATIEKLEKLIKRQSEIMEMMHQELEETTEILDDVRDLHLFETEDDEDE